MKVSSPVGDFPFEAKRLTLRNRRMVLEGAMGAWPAKVELEPKDIVGLVRLIPWPVLAVVGLALVDLYATRRRTGRAGA
jgi:hypothetical protein